MKLRVIKYICSWECVVNSFIVVVISITGRGVPYYDDVISVINFFIFSILEDLGATRPSF